jgi:hypothetical protein
MATTLHEWGRQQFSSDTSNAFLHELYAIVVALCAGAHCQYGVEIRLPHALVMTALFGRRKGVTMRTHLMRIGKAVREHATHLACFAATYKTILAVMKWTSWKLHQLEKEPSAVVCYAGAQARTRSIYRRVGSLLVRCLLLIGKCIHYYYSTRVSSGSFILRVASFSFLLLALLCYQWMAQVKIDFHILLFLVLLLLCHDRRLLGMLNACITAG